LGIKYRFAPVVSTLPTAVGAVMDNGGWCCNIPLILIFLALGRRRGRVFTLRVLFSATRVLTLNDYLLIYCYWIGSHVYNVFNDNYDSGRRVYPSHTRPVVTSVLESSLKQERLAWLREGIIIKGKTSGI
jgi:hypothetical protein